jgi:hypothetical protein
LVLVLVVLVGGGGEHCHSEVCAARFAAVRSGGVEKVCGAFVTTTPSSRRLQQFCASFSLYVTRLLLKAVFEGQLKKIKAHQDSRWAFT